MYDIITKSKLSLNKLFNALNEELKYRKHVASSVND
jgi:hypothetical protein